MLEKYRIIEPDEKLESAILTAYSSLGQASLALVEIVAYLDQNYDARPPDFDFLVRRSVWRLIDHEKIRILDNRRLELSLKKADQDE